MGIRVNDMKSKYWVFLSILIILIVFLLPGCSTTPQYQIWQPWTRIINSNDQLPYKSDIKLIVVGENASLLGNNSLLSNDIKDTFGYLLKRRGYNIVNNSEQFIFILKYRTERKDKLRSSSSIISTNESVSGLLSSTGSLTSLGLGVSLAQAISIEGNSSALASQNTMETITSYTHTISIEINNNDKETIWLGESTWDSKNIDLQTEILPSIQVLLSSLPKDDKYIPTVNKLVDGKERNFYLLRCKDRWFSCPALPYKIKFKKLEDFDAILPLSVKNSEALPAYIDLIQTSEYALPKGSRNPKSNPLNSFLWKKVQLGGKYKLNSSEEVNVLINLVGEPTGYLIDKCWIATDAEYSKFEEQLIGWQLILIDYYDYYEK